MTLLEIILALAIFGGAVAVIGEVSRLGLRSAADARDMTQALLIADTIMAELRIGIRTLEPVFDAAVTSEEFVDTDAADPDWAVGALWLYSIDTAMLDDNGLTAVAVTVTRQQSIAPVPVSVRLVRWIVDPEVEQAEIDAAAEAAEMLM